MARKTTRAFKELLETLPGGSLWEDMWLVYCEGYLDGEKTKKEGYYAGIGLP